MYIEKLQLLNFKNYDETNVLFSPRINVLVGRNGSGKTNLLDAIYYLSMTRSAFASSDNYCLKHDQNFFMVKGTFCKEEKMHELVSSLQLGAKKVFREDQVDYSRFTEHIGKYPVVLMVPDDVDLIKEGSESRRKFFDSIICQMDKKYLDELMQYNYGLKQRNSLLKMFQERGSPDWIALETYDDILIRTGLSIFNRRRVFIDEFKPVFARYFKFIVDDQETTDVHYVSDLDGKSFAEGLKVNRQKDLMLQRTNFGIHRDDYQFSLGSGDLKRLGSQGQQKSFSIALKLAQFEIIEKQKGFKPILLLDDIFDKLDDYRIAKLVELIASELGQIFITDARPDRTATLLQSVTTSAKIFKVEKGVIEQELLP
jgi:DNA replication and repair protein RecF